MYRGRIRHPVLNLVLDATKIRSRRTSMYAPERLAREMGLYRVGFGKANKVLRYTNKPFDIRTSGVPPMIVTRTSHHPFFARSG